MSGDLVRRIREYVAVAVIGWFGTQLIAAVLRDLLEGGNRPMYIEPWLFLVLVFGTSLSVGGGLLIGAVALVALWIRRRPRRKVVHGPRGQRQVEIIGSDGRPL